MADIVGYSRLMAEDEDATVRTVTAYREEIELLIRQNRGRLVDFTGDNFLAEFPSGLYAVRCAVEVQRVLHALNATLSANRRVEFRMGVHLADVRVEGEQRFGTGVNVAARLEALAEPGGLCISAPVLEHVRGNLDLEFDDLGTKPVKNLPDPVHVYRVKLEAAPPEAAPGSMRRVALAVGIVVVLGIVALEGWRRVVLTGTVAPGEISSIAVLPLANLSGDPEQEYVADGMTEALIGELAKLSALRVISRTSVMQYKDAPKPIPEIAEELNVDAVIEGTVIREDDRIRITAQLIDARHDHQLWNERYDREMSGVLALQSDVARAVAEQIRLELTPEEQAALARSRPVDPRAYDAYLRGLQLRGPSLLVGVWGPQAIEQLEQAIDLDPEFAEAYAALATVRVWLGSASFDLRLRSEYLRAREAAQRALALDDRLGEAHGTLGDIRILYDWDFPGALRAYERAVQLSPSNPTALNGYAHYLLLVGRTEEALEVMERLLRVAPLDRFYRQLRPRNFLWARRYGRALEEAERLREEDPDFVDLDIGTSYFMLGRLEEAHREYVAFDARCGAPCEQTLRARMRGWAEGGYEGSVREVLEVFTEAEGLSPWLIAATYCDVNETEEAFTWLERGYRERDPLMVLMKSHPKMDPLRSDPRFDDLLRRIGFPEN
jgi:TolB-like protein/class 3 adenylate cyclase